MFPQIDIEEERIYLNRDFPDQAKQILYEMQYFNLFGELPDNAVVLEAIEVYGDAFLFIHRDPNKVN